MGLLDDPFRDVADVLIDTFTDDKSTITRTTEVYDKTLGTEVSATKSVDVKVSAPENYSNRDIDGKAIQRGDMRVLVAAAAIESEDSTFGQPDPLTDTLARGGIVYAIKGVVIDAGGDKDVMYQLQLRKGSGRG